MATEQIGLPVKTKTYRATHASGISRFLNKYFYFCMSLLVAVVVVYGFSHTVDHNLLHAAPPPPRILWLHGVVFSGWVIFFIFQSALVRVHKVKLHRLTGWFGAGLGVIIPVLGISTAIAMYHFAFARLHAATNISTFLSIQILDITSFTIPFWLAIYWRKKPEYHRRLVLIATCALTSAAFGRFPMLPLAWSYTGVDALILLGIVRDLIVNRRIHVVYRYALPMLMAGQIFAVQIWLLQPAWWAKTAYTLVMG